ncbi:MAG: hypothetical protein ACK42D_03555 [Candidatus Paceibacteria bacterium]
MTSSQNISKSWYHSILRISVLLFALALVFESGILSPATKTFSHITGQQFATAIHATIDTATYDESGVLAPEVQSQQISQANTASTQPLSRSTFLLSTLVFILLLLIVLNYILDYLRNRERQHRFS